MSWKDEFDEKTLRVGKKFFEECDPESKPYFFIPDMADRYSVRNEDYEKACDLLEKNEITEAAAP